MNETAGTLTLYELNSIVSFGIKKVLPDSYWVVAELNEVRTASNGHCFVEMVEKDEGTNLIAKARGTVWSNVFTRLRRKFMQETGRDITAGMKVRVNVTVEFHELYGYSLNIIDIDSAYTLGDLYMKRKEIMLRLEQAGVIGMNRELGLPAVVQRIAVISSPTAAGYGDFCDQLRGNPYGIAFHIELFPAAMQGDRVEDSVIAALDAINARSEEFDAVVLVRGGGATSDLSAFDSFDIAFHVAQYPLPVISGIGHERDRTVVDEVACVAVKTPTAAAQHIITHDHAFVTRLEGIASAITTSITASIARQKLLLGTGVSRLDRAATALITAHKAWIAGAQSRLDRQLRTRLHTSTARLAAVTARMPALVSMHCGRHSSSLDRIGDRLAFAVRTRLDRQRGRLQLMEGIAAASEPSNVLRKGFSIIRTGGVAVRTVASLEEGHDYEVEMADGKTTITINKTRQ